MAEVSDETGGDFASVTSEGFDIIGNGETAEDMTANLTPEPKDGEDEGEKVSKAAKELGKRGGKASAERRARAGDDASAPDLDAADAEKPLGKPRDDPRARMLEATRKEAEAKKELAAERAERQRIEGELRSEREGRRAAPQQERKPEADPDPEPDIANYDDYNQFVKDSARWAGRHEARKEAQAIQQRQWVAQKSHEKAQSVEAEIKGFQGKVDQAKAKDPECLAGIADHVWDFLQPSWEAPPGQIDQGHVMADEIMGLDNPVAVLNHLSANREEFQRIASLQNVLAITRALAKLDARFGAVTAGTSPKPSVSKAPPPVRPVTGAPSAVDSDDEDAPFEEHVRRMNAKDAQRRRGVYAR